MRASQNLRGWVPERYTHAGGCGNPLWESLWNGRLSPHHGVSRRAMNRICVFCGSNPGARPEYIEAARRMGVALVQRGLGLVYGGGRLALVGASPDTGLPPGGPGPGV